MTQPATFAVGDILRIIPDGDIYDNALAEVIKVRKWDECDVTILSGKGKGDIKTLWPPENFIIIPPLEQLAMEAE